MESLKERQALVWQQDQEYKTSLAVDNPYENFTHDFTCEMFISHVKRSYEKSNHYITFENLICEVKSHVKS